MEWPTTEKIVQELEKLNFGEVDGKKLHLVTGAGQKAKSLTEDGRWFFGEILVGIESCPENQHTILVTIDLDKKDISAKYRILLVAAITNILQRQPACYFEADSCAFFVPNAYKNEAFARKVHEWDSNPVTWVEYRKNNLNDDTFEGIRFV